MRELKLYRKRFIPNETVLLKDDTILFSDEEIIVTKWSVLKPRLDFSKGYSCYYLKRGYKVSKFMDNNDNLVYYYCDIIDVNYNEKENALIFSDLLADVVVYKDGRIKVVDLAEIADALDKELITYDLAKKSLRCLDELLNVIYDKGIEYLFKTEMEK